MLIVWALTAAIVNTKTERDAKTLTIVDMFAIRYRRGSGERNNMFKVSVKDWEGDEKGVVRKEGRKGEKGSVEGANNGQRVRLLYNIPSVEDFLCCIR